MSAVMRAKLEVCGVKEHFFDGNICPDNDGQKSMETLEMRAVAANSYTEDGSDEDNTYAKFSPSAHFTIDIMNPALFGKFEAGQKYYVDFTPAD